jgi:hypothetical protein
MRRVQIGDCLKVTFRNGFALNEVNVLWNLPLQCLNDSDTDEVVASYRVTDASDDHGFRIGEPTFKVFFHAARAAFQD